MDDNNIMAQDLEARVPVKGLADCQMDKGETPLRMRRQDATGEQRKTLGEVWKVAQWKRERRGKKEIRIKFSPSNDNTPTTVASKEVINEDRASP